MRHVFLRTDTLNGRGVWAYRKQQWFCLLMEKLRIPLPLLLPKPVFVIVDNFEEVLRQLVRCITSTFGTLPHFQLAAKF